MPSISMNRRTSISLTFGSLALSLAGLASFARPSTPTALDDDVWNQEQLEAVTAEIQSQVESIRGDAFKRPVAVKITDKAGFLEYVTKRMAAMGGAEKIALEEQVAKMLGLIPPSMDYQQELLDMLEGQVGGFYDPASETFYLMESFTGGFARLILAHELTHALDDQYFDLDGSFEALLNDRDASSAYHAVVEGSGTSLMMVWTMQHLDELKMEDLQELAAQQSDSLAGVPATIWKPLLFSYQQGQSFLQKGYRLLKKQGKSMADVTRMAFEAPPTSTEQVLHPEKYWDAERRDDPRRLEISASELPEGWTLLETSTIGELLFALVSEGPKEIDFADLGALQAIEFTNTAAAGWGGDRAALYGREGARFLYVVSDWDTSEDAQEFESALRRRLEPWRASLAELDPEGVGSGLRIELELERRRVELSVWYGVQEETAQALIEGQRVIELPVEPTVELEAEHNDEPK